ncbi:hypothetical protein [Cohnella nanjingensis]|uniref:Uncharacterized protein n=1 Tax=Cohnella nanjingensis TaxID=1387779 RepID=A0A7X0VE59_9BACL|nr:hypothetical protein [Cohnella nanjingensis]MBB6670672.1 hypothetical protein [Cohnella nanjingensis]
MERRYVLQSGEKTRLVFEYDEREKSYGYHLEKAGEDRWHRLTEPFQPLVQGKYFGLYPEKIALSACGDLEVSGTKNDADGFLYDWQGTVSADSATGWIRFDITLSGASAFTLDSNRTEPEITVNLGTLPPYERGDHVWFKTNIDNPTEWNNEARGNDFPACYYYDSYQKFGVMMFFDMSSMGWMAKAGIPRFLQYRCGLRREYARPPGRLSLGLVADGPFQTEFPVEGTRFSYGIRSFTQETPPTEQSAVVDLVEACLDWVPGAVEPPANAGRWSVFADRCAEELMNEEACWNNNGAYDMLIPYVNGVSPAWEESFAAKGLTVDFRNHPGLDAALMMIHPLAQIARAFPTSANARLRDKVWTFIRHAGEDMLLNQNDRVWGTWQYIYLLEEWWRAARLDQDRASCSRIEEEVERVIIPLARNCGYLFPLSFRVPELKKHGNGDAYPIAGAYAYFMYLLYKAKGDAVYLEEAEHAIRVLMHAPVNSLHQESHLLAMAVQAADCLQRETGDTVYEEIYRYLLAQNLRMVYWYNDPSFPDYRIWGMFQACTPMLYPAFFENVECAARIASTLKGRKAHAGLLRILNQARINNLYCFPQCLPERYRLSDLAYIPLENLGTLEDDKTGYAGQEIYGAGQTFRAALLWDGILRSEDPNVCLMSLDVYEWEDEAVASGTKSFLVHYSGEKGQVCSMDIATSFRAARCYSGNAPAEAKPVQIVEGRLFVDLLPGETVTIEIDGVNGHDGTQLPLQDQAGYRLQRL